MAAPAIQIVVLGSGTSVGVPTIGCHCVVCSSDDPRDNRLRPSILVRYEGRNVLIDTTPDFRFQALRAKLNHLDAVIFTHAHADHIMGLDDVRRFNTVRRGPLDVWCDDRTVDVTFIGEAEQTWPEFLRDWEESDTAPRAMSRVREIFSDKLRETKETITRLERLVGDLTETLAYMDSCRSCEPTHTQAECGTCDIHGHDGRAPLLVEGISK